MGKDALLNYTGESRQNVWGDFWTPVTTFKARNVQFHEHILDSRSRVSLIEHVLAHTVLRRRCAWPSKHLLQLGLAPVLGPT